MQVLEGPLRRPVRRGQVKLESGQLLDQGLEPRGSALRKEVEAQFSAVRQRRPDGTQRGERVRE